MTRKVTFIVVIVMVGLLAGCDGAGGRGQIITAAEKQTWDPELISVVNAGETDIVEQTVANRQAYRKGLERLIDYYDKTGNNRPRLEETIAEHFYSLI